MTIWFTSDTHFNHSNIIKYCDRPFKNVTEMDDTIIDNWNSLVKKDDRIYHLGDFCLGSKEQARSYIDRLNGWIHILGNDFHHDKQWLLSDTRDLDIYIHHPMVVLEFEEYSRNSHPRVLVLCHYPIQVWDRKHYLSWHLYGHVHNKNFSIPDSPLSMNVGVDCNDFTPVSLEAVAEKFLKIEKDLNLKAINE